MAGVKLTRVQIVCAIVVVVLSFAIPATFTCMQVSSDSMTPTLQSGDYILVDKISGLLARRYSRPGVLQRGAIVVLAPPPEAPVSLSDYIVKRVVALAGDQVFIDHGRLMVNNIAVDEPYLASTGSYAGQPSSSWPLISDESRRGIIIPASCIFVLGDNRSESADSRLFGPVNRDAVVGNVVFTFHQIRKHSRW